MSERCKKCGKQEPDISFRLLRSGLYRKECRSCEAKGHKERRDAIGKTEHVRKLDRGRSKRYRRNHPEIARAYSQYAKKARRLQLWAKGRVQTEIHAGRLKRKPCEVCGNYKSHAHHHDYNKPLSVRWLCSVHHAEVHRAMRSA